MKRCAACGYKLTPVTFVTVPPRIPTHKQAKLCRSCYAAMIQDKKRKAKIIPK